MEVCNDLLCRQNNSTTSYHESNINNNSTGTSGNVEKIEKAFVCWNTLKSGIYCSCFFVIREEPQSISGNENDVGEQS